MNERLPEWAADVHFIVKKLKEDYSNYIDFEKGIGITGQTMKKPFLQICNSGNVSVVSKALMDTNVPIEFAIFEGITHLGFTDMKFYVRSKMMMGKMPAQEMSDRLIGLHMKFFERYL